ncbi:hypothetical protein [Sulfitobacter faviae]|uniref:hypothetical protein n=1 Tax=Sulfitobacter faviae TaxID=1775881 RepID=UPI00398CAA4B
MNKPLRRTPMRRVSKKRAARRASKQGQADLAYMGLVKQLPCCICGSPPPNDAHHCRSQPSAGEPHAYEQLPAAGRRSGDRDTIPLCHWDCHQEGPESYHRAKRSWEARNGPDYSYIPSTRAAVAAMIGEIDF